MMLTTQFFPKIHGKLKAKNLVKVSSVCFLMTVLATFAEINDACKQKKKKKKKFFFSFVRRELLKCII